MSEGIYKTESLELYHADCMEVMGRFPDGYFDLAIVDPPYGLDAPRMNMGAGFSGGKYRGRLGNGGGKLKGTVLQKLNTEWDSKPPGPEYFQELFRVSKNQVVWGGNYFPLPPTRCVVVWDKQQPWENFSQVELAWTSFDKPAKLFSRMNGGGQKGGKIHPTQKPVELYQYLLAQFAEPGMRVLDTHLGSGSIAVAAHYYGVHLVGCELDEVFFRAACERIERETAQGHFL